MRRTLVGRLGLIGIVAVLGACAGNRRTSNSRSDLGGVFASEWDSGVIAFDAQPGAHDSWASPQVGDGNPSDIWWSTNENKSCSEIMGCQQYCSQQECVEWCSNKGSETARLQWDAYVKCRSDAMSGTCKAKCADAKSAACGACMFESCWPADLACMSGEKSGTASCAEIYHCLYACNAELSVCPGSCLAQATATAQQAFYAIEICESNAPAGTCATQCQADQLSDACGDCQWQTCWESELTCMSGGKTGTASCQTTSECYDDCTEGDDVCRGACLAEATAAAQQALYAIWICEGKAYSGTCATTCRDDESEACDTCIEQACSTQYNACT